MGHFIDRSADSSFILLMKKPPNDEPKQVLAGNGLDQSGFRNPDPNTKARFVDDSDEEDAPKNFPFSGQK